MFKGIATTVIFILTGAVSVRAAAISYTGSNGGDWAENSNWSGGSYPGAGDYALLDKTASLGSVTPNNIAGIRIGTVGSGILNITNGASMTATASTPAHGTAVVSAGALTLTVQAAYPIISGSGVNFGVDVTSVFAGKDPNDTWTLFFADTSAVGQTTVNE
jgi:hypothetical protein